MADDIEFGGTGEVTEEELGDGISVVDVDAVDEVDDADAPVEDIDPLLPKPGILDEEEDTEKVEEEIDPEEEAYFYGDKYDEK